MRVVPGLDRADALAGEARQGPGARRQGAGPHRPHHRQRSYLRVPAGYLPDAAAAARWARCNRFLAAGSSATAASRSARSPRARRSSLLANLQIVLDSDRSRRTSLRHDKQVLELLIKAQARPQGPARRRDRRRRRGRSSRTWSSRCSRSASARTSSSTAATTSAPTASRKSRACRDADKRALIEFLKTF